MANTLAQKLKIKEGYTLLTLHAPPNFATQLAPLPPGVTITENGKAFDQVHWFVTSKSQLDKELNKMIKVVKDEVLCWVYYPKGSSKIQTDLTRDKGWEELLKHDEFQWISLIAFDETWSAFGFRMKTEGSKPDSKPNRREIFEYVNAEKKEIRLPEDLAEALKKNKSEAATFDKLSFTNKKEYVEWIVTAKREETRKQRVDGTIERLTKGWKNPRNL